MRICWGLFLRGFVLGSNVVACGARLTRVIYYWCGFSCGFFGFLWLFVAFSRRILVANLVTRLFFGGSSGG